MPRMIWESVRWLFRQVYDSMIGQQTQLKNGKKIVICKSLQTNRNTKNRPQYSQHVCYCVEKQDIKRTMITQW